MNIFKEYRITQGKTLKEMREELLEICPRITVSLLSQIENGIVNPPEEMMAYYESMMGPLPEEHLTEKEMAVLEAVLKHGRDNPISRRELRVVTKENDNRSRVTIGNLRDKGYPIISSPTGGYYFADQKELEEWLPKYKSYIFTMLRRMRAMKNRQLKGQVKINGL